MMWLRVRFFISIKFSSFLSRRGFQTFTMSQKAYYSGTTLNYFLDDRINKAEILFPGVGCFPVALFLRFAVHKSNAADNKAKLRSSARDFENEKTYEHKYISWRVYVCKERLEIQELYHLYCRSNMRFSNSLGKLLTVSKLLTSLTIRSMDFEKANETKIKPDFGCVGIWLKYLDWLPISSLLGCAFLSSLHCNLPTNDQFHNLKEGVPHLVVYTAFFCFLVSCFVIAIILNVIFLYHPILDLPKSSFKAYLRH